MTISDLKNTEKRETIAVYGKYTIGDGGEGRFFWNANSMEEDDGGIIIQVQGVIIGRFIRVIETRYAHMEWFLGDTTSNPRENWKALCGCIKTGLKILLRKIYRIYHEVPFITNNDILIEGINRWTAGLIFESKTVHFDSIREPIYHNGIKIGNASGLNMSFSNGYFVTSDYENFKDNNYLDNVRFNNFFKLQEAGDKNRIVNVDYVKFNDCFLGGALQVELTASGIEIPGYGVNTVRIEDNHSAYAYSLASISAFPKETDIHRNDVYNLKEVFTRIKQGKNINANDNHVENDFILETGKSYSHGYMAFILAGGAEKLEGRRNTFKNMLSRSGVVTYPVYPSVDNFIWEDNISIDCFALSDSAEIPLVKLKQAGNIDMSRNKCIITRQGLVKMGLLEHVDSPIETVDDKYKVCILSASNDYDPGFKTRIKYNEFTVPFINMASHMMSDDHEIERNIINIEYIQQAPNPSVFQRGELIFNFEGRDRDILKHNNNTYNIGKAYNSEVGAIGFTKCNHNEIENSGNTYIFGEPLKLNVGKVVTSQESTNEGRRSKKYKALNNYINQGSVEDVASVAFETNDFPNTELSEVEYTIGNFNGKTAQTHIANLESKNAEVRILNNNSNEFGVFRFLFSEFTTKVHNPYFDGIKAISIKVKIAILDNEGKGEILYYTLSVSNRLSLMYSNSKYPVIERNQDFNRTVTNNENKTSPIRLVHRNFMKGDASYLVFEGLQQYKSYIVSVIVEKI